MNYKIEYLPVGKLKINPENPRLIRDVSFKSLVKSLVDCPNLFDARPCLCSDRTGELIVLAGNMRLLAARELKYKTVPVIIMTGLTEMQEREILIKDNGSTWGEWDFDLLSGWSDLPLNSWGVNLPEDWLSGPPAEPVDAEPQMDKAEELNKVWKVKYGDLWQIGSHRLLCGDSCNAEDVARVMNGEKADMVFTDPPYGITLISGKKGKVGGGTKEYPTTTFQAIQGDDKPFDPSLLLGIAPVTIIWGGNYFADKLPVSRCWFIWNKNHSTDRTFAGCELAWTNLDRHAKVFDCTWDGWTKQGESGSKVHPSQKPVKLCTDILAEVEGEIILDPFLGSGTTLIACENLKRRCFGIEISPAYVAVCLQRFEDAFGIKGTLIQDGERQRPPAHGKGGKG